MRLEAAESATQLLQFVAFPCAPQCGATQRGDRVFVHVLTWQDAELALPALPRRVRTASLLVGGTQVPFRQTPSGVVLTLPPRPAGDVDQVVVLELAGLPH